MSASVATLGSMGVLIQAMTWLQMEMPPAWVMVLYMTCIGMFGIGMGRIADAMSRTRLLAVGLALWSTMTALSGVAFNFAALASARLGVGIGEAIAVPVEDRWRLPFPFWDRAQQGFPRTVDYPFRPSRGQG